VASARYIRPGIFNRIVLYGYALSVVAACAASLLLRIEAWH
jgi:hypothetical protein